MNPVTIVVRNDRPTYVDDSTVEYYPEVVSFGGDGHRGEWFTGQTTLAMHAWRCVEIAFGRPPPHPRWRVTIEPAADDEEPPW